MNILVTGAKGFVGRNLCLELKNIRDGKARCWGDVKVDELFDPARPDTYSDPLENR